MKRLMAKVFGRTGTRAATTARPGLETLEGREVPAVAFINLSAGVLTVNTTEQRDVVTLSNPPTRYPNPSQIWVTVTNNGSTTDFGPFLASSVNRIDVNLGSGDDDLTNITNKYVIAHGGSGHDTLRGGSGWDDLYGDDGNDWLYGGAGDDILDGGNGGDWLLGQDGNDSLHGGSGADYLFGGNGDDRLDGGYDGTTDYLYGEWGRDTYVLHKYKPWWSFSWYTEGDYTYDLSAHAYDYYLDAVTYIYH